MKMERLATLRVLLDNPLHRPEKPKGTSNVDVVWLRTYGSSGNILESCSTIPDDGGHYIIAGTLTASSGQNHVYLTKLDGNGTQVWEKTYTGPGDYRTGAATRCCDHGLVLVGTSEPEDGEGVFVLRTDSRGNLLWESRYDIDGIVDVTCVFQEKGGDFIVFGTILDEPGGNAFMMRILPSGELVWQGFYDSGFKDSVRRSFEGNGSYFIVGDAEDPGRQDILVIRVEPGGREIWTRTYGAAGVDSATYGLMDKDNTIIVAGRSATRGHDGPYLMGLDVDGNTIFDRIYQWDGGTILGLAPSQNGGYCAIGRGGSLLKLDGNWDRVWDTGWEPVGPEASISTHGDGYYLIAGSLSGKIHAVKVHEPVVELPIHLLPAFLIISLLVLGSIQHFPVD
jgi:hypothetical protein